MIKLRTSGTYQHSCNLYTHELATRTTVNSKLLINEPPFNARDRLPKSGEKNISER